MFISVLLKHYLRLKHTTQSLEEYFSQFMRICDGLNTYQHSSSDVPHMQQQREDLNVVYFLISLRSEYEPIRAQILDSLKLPLHSDVFFRHQSATLSWNNSQLSSEDDGDRSPFVTSHGSLTSREGRGGGEVHVGTVALGVV